MQLDQLLQFIAAVATEFARNDDTLTRQQIRVQFALLSLELHPCHSQTLDNRTVGFVGKELDNTSSDLIAHLFGLDELLDHSIHYCLHRTKMSRKVFSRRFAHEADTQCKQHTRKRH